MRLPRDGIYARPPIPNDAWRERWPNFTPAELACNHCGEYVHDTAFLNKLQALRWLVDKPFKINSGHRCRVWNTEVTKNPNSRSQHLHIAVDIDLNGHDRHDLAALAKTMGFTGIGYGKTFLHLDLRKTPERVTWFYPDSREAWKK